MAEITISISDRSLKAAGTIFVLICAAAMILVLWSSHFFRPKYRLRMYVSEVAGLRIGTPVRLNGGIEVGKVEQVNPSKNSPDSDHKIELVLRLEKRYQDHILNDSMASLVTEGLRGSRFVSIIGGFQGTPLGDNAQIETLPGKEIKLSDVLNSTSKLADCLNQVVNAEQSRNPSAGDNSAKTSK